jgi:predicted aspartyl protease
MSKTVIYPVDRQDYMFYIRGAIGGTDRRSKIVRLLVDTGARNTVLPAQLLRELGCNLDNPQRNIQITAAGGVLQVPRIIVPWFNCLGNRHEKFEVIALDLPRSAGIDGLLGMDFLTEIGAIVDIEQAQISVK